MRKYGLILVILSCLLLVGCSVGRKSWGLSSSADAFKVVMVDPSNGSSAPEIVAGGGCFSAIFAVPYEDKDNMATHIAYSRRRSIWNIFSSASASNISIVYISGSKETPDETAKILDAFGRIVNDGK